MAERRWLGSLIWGVVMLLVGIVVGGIGPRAGLREARAELARMDPKRCETTIVGREVARAIATGISQREASGSATVRRRPPPAPSEPVEVTEPVEVGGASYEPVTGSLELPAPDPLEADDARLAADTLDLRKQQALAALVEQARPDDAQLAEIQGVIDDMNADLALIADDLFALASSGEEPTRLDWMVFGADFLDVFIDAEMGLAESLSDDQLASVDPAVIDPFSYVDGRLAESLERFHAGGE